MLRGERYATGPQRRLLRGFVAAQYPKKAECGLRLTYPQVLIAVLHGCALSVWRLGEAALFMSESSVLPSCQAYLRRYISSERFELRTVRLFHCDGHLTGRTGMAVSNNSRFPSVFTGADNAFIAVGHRR